MLIGPQNLEARVIEVKRRIDHATAEAGRECDSVTLVAVSKTQRSESVRSVAAAGVRDFGENYVQEALDKMRALADLDLRWHFIGALQANKTKEIAAHFDWVHGIDRFKVAQRLSAQRPFHANPLEVCVQVELVSETNKSGVPAESVAALLEQMRGLQRLRVRGLMCIPPPMQNEQAQRALFERMGRLLGDLNAQGHALDTLSMGMSDDFEIAIAAGSTMVRVGTAVFGPR